MQNLKVKLVEDVILILLMQFLLKHHFCGMALSQSLRDDWLKSLNHIDELIIRQRVLLLILRLLWVKGWKGLSLNLCIVSKEEGVKKVLLCCDSGFNIYDLFLCEKSFFFISLGDLILNLEERSIYLQE